MPSFSNNEILQKFNFKSFTSVCGHSDMKESLSVYLLCCRESFVELKISVMEQPKVLAILLNFVLQIQKLRVRKIH